MGHCEEEQVSDGQVIQPTGVTAIYRLTAITKVTAWPQGQRYTL